MNLSLEEEEWGAAGGGGGEGARFNKGSNK